MTPEAEFIGPAGARSSVGPPDLSIAVSPTFHDTPILPPELIEQCERICPGMAAELIRLGIDAGRQNLAFDREEVAHRRSLEIADRRRLDRGQRFALPAVLAVLGLCAYGFSLGHALTAATVVIATVVAMTTHSCGVGLNPT